MQFSIFSILDSNLRPLSHKSNALPSEDLLTKGGRGWEGEREGEGGGRVEGEKEVEGGRGRGRGEGGGAEGVGEGGGRV